VSPLRVAGILSAGFRGIGILPMDHGQDAHATQEQGPDALATSQRLDFAEGLAVVTSLRQGSLELESRVEAVTQPDLACRLSLRARADRRAWLVVSARPCNPEGISFIHRISLDETHTQWRVNRRHSVHFSEPADLYAASD